MKIHAGTGNSKNYQTNKHQVIMKSKIKLAGILLVLILFPVIFPKQVSAQAPYISYQVFYDQLPVMAMYGFRMQDGIFILIRQKVTG
jgi:hypothetical protein